MKKFVITASLIVAASLIPRESEAQSIASRVASARDGRIRMSFASKPGICGFGNGISRGNNMRQTWGNNTSPDVIYDEECSHTPVRVVLDVDNGRVTKIRTYVGGRWRPAASDVTDLGLVSVRDATSYLLSLASNEDPRAAKGAILPVTLADSVNVYPQLFRIARNEGIPRDVRRDAIFWLGQAASERINPDKGMRGRESEESEVKKQAVFAISQRRNGEAVPALIQVARTNRDPDVRSTALFWLGQTADARAVSLFEEILSR